MQKLRALKMMPGGKRDETQTENVGPVLYHQGWEAEVGALYRQSLWKQFSASFSLPHDLVTSHNCLWPTKGSSTGEKHWRCSWMADHVCLVSGRP